MNSRPSRWLIVCKGNICRSPFAAACIEQLWSRGHTSHLDIRSVGIEAYHLGKGAHRLTIQVGKEFGLDLSRHVVRQITSEDLEWCDFVLVMDRENLSRLRQNFPTQIEHHEVSLLGEYLGRELDIPDPYNKDERAFRESFRMIRSAATALVDSLGQERVRDKRQ